MTVATLISFDELSKLRASWQRQGASVALVPTMGALHDGHLRLVLEGKKYAEKVIVSIFVNPSQFGPKEDFEKYPRTVRSDVEKLETIGADAVFLPNAASIYPAGYQTYLYNRDLDDQLCGKFRPGHFEGVLTVVLKLINLVNPDVALFGKKDYQQLRLIETMARDLHLPVKIIGMPTLREPDGLAMSSRNRYMTDAERPVAAKIFQGLEAARLRFEAGERETAKILAAYLDVVGTVPEFRHDYAEIRLQAGLQPPGEKLEAPSVLLVALRFGDVRLIDNMELG